MSELTLIEKLAEVLQEIPLKPSRRRCCVGNSKFGYRDILFGGDIRQLPPASGRMPYWAVDEFYEDFEIFVLAEDRRHEKDLATHNIKEAIAWGGVSDPMLHNPDDNWPVAEVVMEHIIDGYLQGWGLSGEIVDLDIGTNLSSRRADVNRWNNACVDQIEAKYGATCEAVDVRGYNPLSSLPSVQAQKNSMSGIQAPKVLRLRTCQTHRARVILLTNLCVQDCWASFPLVRHGPDRVTCLKVFSVSYVHVPISKKDLWKLLVATALCLHL